MMEPFISSSLLDEVVEEAAEELLEKCRSGRVKEEKIGELFFELLVKHIIIIERREENAGKVIIDVTKEEKTLRITPKRRIKIT